MEEQMTPTVEQEPEVAELVAEQKVVEAAEVTAEPKAVEAVEIAAEPQVAEKPAPVVCAKCGYEIPEGMKFCPNCGKQVNAPEKVPFLKRILAKKGLLIGIAAAVVAALVALVIILLPPKEIPVADIVLSTSDVEIKESETATVSCTVYPQDATNKKVIWTSSNPSIATVNELGTITAVAKGECVITAQCGELTKMINIKVKANIDFKALYEEVDADVKYGWSVGSDGSYLSADTNVYNLDDYSNSSIWASIKEMNGKLGLPDSLNQDMLKTTWSMGRQNKTFTSLGLEVTWTYHPDKGMEVTYKLLED